MSKWTLFVCQPGQCVSWIALYHLQEVRRGRTLTFTHRWQFALLSGRGRTSPPLTNSF